MTDTTPVQYVRRLGVWDASMMVVGGIIGGLLLLNTGEKLFSELGPFLILLPSGLLAIQEPMRAWLVRRSLRSFSLICTGRRMVRPWSETARLTAWRIHQVA